MHSCGCKVSLDLQLGLRLISRTEEGDTQCAGGMMIWITGLIQGKIIGYRHENLIIHGLCGVIVHVKPI